MAGSNEETRDAIVTLLEAELEKGLSIQVACDLVGITNAAYYRWQKRAEAGDEEAIGLMRRLKAARAKGFEQGLGRIKAKAELTEDWRADAWLIDKLYPNWVGRVEEIVYELSGQEDGEKVAEWSTPDRLRALVLGAVETGVISYEELLRLAPKQARPAEQPSNQQPAADRMETIRAAVIDTLADGPREKTELRDVVCAMTECSHEELQQACDGLDLEQQVSPGSKPMVRLASVPPGHSRTTPAVAPSTADPGVRDESTGSDGETAGSSSSWLAGEPGTGVGDMIARRRGR